MTRNAKARAGVEGHPQAGEKAEEKEGDAELEEAMAEITARGVVHEAQGAQDGQWVPSGWSVPDYFRAETRSPKRFIPSSICCSEQAKEMRMCL